MTKNIIVAGVLLSLGMTLAINAQREEAASR